MSRRHGLIAGWSAALMVATLFACLGGWQLSRMKQKQSMLDAVAQVLQSRQPRSLGLAADVERARSYDWVAGSGRFSDRPAFVLDNQIRDGVAGLRVYRIFEPENVPPVLVDLGWTGIADPVTRFPDRSILQGEALRGRSFELRGLLAPPPSAGLALGPPLVPGEAVLMTRVDIQAIATQAGLDALPPRVLRLDPELPIGLVRDLDVLPNTLPPERHLGYAVQWFGMAIAVLCIAFVLTLRSRSR